uniref:TFIIS N-terminal domain-containing protein n=1 Tax=Rhabditophanes sp. KR3021 TaxID=114890 RepID=A0AC35TUX0_9BILA
MSDNRSNISSSSSPEPPRPQDEKSKSPDSDVGESSKSNPRKRSHSPDGSPQRTTEEVKLDNNLFGDDSDDESIADDTRRNEQYEEPSEEVTNYEEDNRHSEDERPRRVGFGSDFDEIMMQRKLANKNKRRKKNDNSTALTGIDDTLKDLVTRMLKAAAKDRELNAAGKPAPNKVMMLSEVKNMLLAQDRFEQIVDSNLLEGVAHWLTPLPTNALPSIQIRTIFIKLLHDFYKKLDTQCLKECGLGRAVMYLSNHPEETYENKKIAKKLIRSWMEPIFAGELEEKARMLKEKREREAIYEASKPRRPRQVIFIILNVFPTLIIFSRWPTANDGVEIARARVPQYAPREYLIRPKSSHIQAEFNESSTRTSTLDRLTKVSRAFKDRTKAAAGSSSMAKVSIEGRRM